MTVARSPFPHQPPGPWQPTPAAPGADCSKATATQLVNEDKLRRILTHMLDEARFLGPYGIRSISRWHLEHPYSFHVDGRE